MTPYECYIDYLALKRHFTTDSYDYFKYNGKVNAKKESFEKRKDKFFFEKLSRHRDPHGLILANLLQSNETWIKDLVGDKAQENYNEWVKKNQSLTYIVSNELSNLKKDFDSNFRVVDGQLPPIIDIYLGNKISLETLLICVDILGCLPYWNNKLKDNIVWIQISMIIKKSIPFMKYDKTKIKKVVIDFFA